MGTSAGYFVAILAINEHGAPLRIGLYRALAVIHFNKAGVKVTHQQVHGH